MKGWLLVLAFGAVALGCNPEDVQETTRAYYDGLSLEQQVEKARELSRVMPFYVVGACLALMLMGIAVANALEHARALGKGESLRLGAYLLLLCFISLFLAMNFEREWLPAGYPVQAFGITALVGALSTAVAARVSPERAVLLVGYLAVTLALPLLGILLSDEVYLMDTSASLFIGFASGLLLTIVLSGPVRGGLVDFLRRRELP